MARARRPGQPGVPGVGVIAVPGEQRAQPRPRPRAQHPDRRRAPLQRGRDLLPRPADALEFDREALIVGQRLQRALEGLALGTDERQFLRGTAGIGEALRGVERAGTRRSLSRPAFGAKGRLTL